MPPKSLNLGATEMPSHPRISDKSALQPTQLRFQPFQVLRAALLRGSHVIHAAGLRTAFCCSSDTFSSHDTLLEWLWAFLESLVEGQLSWGKHLLFV